MRRKAVDADRARSRDHRIKREELGWAAFVFNAQHVWQIVVDQDGKLPRAKQVRQQRSALPEYHVLSDQTGKKLARSFGAPNFSQVRVPLEILRIEAELSFPSWLEKIAVFLRQIFGRCQPRVVTRQHRSRVHRRPKTL